MLKVYNRDGNVKGEMEFPKKLWSEWNPKLIQQVFTSLVGNQRIGAAHTKDRSEVRGGGKKPWAQKGTGRARHGSIRSPLWRGGGTTFGPRSEQDFSRKINKKMLRGALLSVLSKKAADGELKVIDSLELEVPKTKTLATLFDRVADRHSRLVLVPKSNENVHRAARNIARTKTISASQLNVVDLLQYQDVITDTATLEAYSK